MKKCATCDFEYDDAYDACPQCARSVQARRQALAIDARMILGLGGVALVFLGVFMPIVSLPIVGTVNYFNNGKGDGVMLLALALISALLVAVKRYRGLLATGGASAAMLAYSFLALTQRLAEAQASLESSLAGNPFAGLAQAAMQSVQIQWGWAVLVLGALLILGAGVLKGQSPAVKPPLPRATDEARQALGVISEGARLAGRALYYSDETFSVEGTGPVGVPFVRLHDERGQIEWSTPQARAFAIERFGSAAD